MAEGNSYSATSHGIPESQNPRYSNVGPSGDGLTQVPQGAESSETQVTSATESSVSTSPDIPHILPNRVRDPSADSGERDADEVYRRLFVEYYPDFREKVYRVPPLFIGRSNCYRHREFEVYRRDPVHVRGDEAEQLTADSIESLLQQWVEEKYPSFIITSYQFENFCDKDGKPSSDRNQYIKVGETSSDGNKHIKVGEPSSDRNKNIKGKEPSSKRLKDIKDGKPIRGEHDILIVHYKYGVIFIQVKSRESTTYPYEAVKKAIEQLQEDEKFFKVNFKDVTDVSITTVVALPDNEKECLEKKFSEDFPDIKLDQCLFKGDLPRKDDLDIEAQKQNLLEWWREITMNSKGFSSFEDYKKVVARYIGYKSTVKIHIAHSLSKKLSQPEGRTESTCVSHIGNRYQNITLTPQQVCVLKSDEKRLVIRGSYGAGKTVLLMLKIRHMRKKNTTARICVVSMSPSPLRKVLEESILYDTPPFPPDPSNPLRFLTVLGPDELNTVIEDCSKTECNIFIDEFPSFIFKNANLQTSIKNFPKHLYLWCIMSRERGDTMRPSLQHLFPIGEPPGFNEVVMKEILRSPPSIGHLIPKYDQCIDAEKELFSDNAEDGLDIKQTVSDYFVSLGLDTPSAKWSDVMIKVMEKKNVKTICDWLDESPIPVVKMIKDKTDPKAVFGPNKMLITDAKNAEGFCRKHTITIYNGAVFENKKEPKSTEGPPVEHIDHSQHDRSLSECETCEEQIKGCLQRLGLLKPASEVSTGSISPTVTGQGSTSVPETGTAEKSRVTAEAPETDETLGNGSNIPPRRGLVPTGSEGMEQNIFAQARSPRNELTFDDLVILDDRVGEENAGGLFRRIGVPVEDRLNKVRLDDEDAFGKVLYTKSRLFKGLERKVVVAIRNKACERTTTVDRKIEDGPEVAVTRCASKLIDIKTS